MRLALDAVNETTSEGEEVAAVIARILMQEECITTATRANAVVVVVAPVAAIVLDISTMALVVCI